MNSGKKESQNNEEHNIFRTGFQNNDMGWQ